VTHPRRPLRLNVGFLLNQPVGYIHEFPFALEKIQIADDLDLRQFNGAALIDRTQQGLLVQGTFKASTTLECARCLKEFEAPLHWSLTEMYAFNRRSLTESDLLLPEDAHIDLQPLIRDYALLEIPIRPVCRPGCKGLCPVCGEDRNRSDCGHRLELDDSPFSALKDLLDK
jgi:uncharacterized protein